jgi:hypothetical protein
VSVIPKHETCHQNLGLFVRESCSGSSDVVAHNQGTGGPFLWASRYSSLRGPTFLSEKQNREPFVDKLQKWTVSRSNCPIFGTVCFYPYRGRWKSSPERRFIMLFSFLLLFFLLIYRCPRLPLVQPTQMLLCFIFILFFAKNGLNYLGEER